MATQLSLPAMRSRDPPCRWQDAERYGRRSHLPPKAMARTYRSELRRRELMAADEAKWRQLSIEIAEREKADEVLLRLAASFADLLCSTTGLDLSICSGVERIDIGNCDNGIITRSE